MARPLTSLVAALLLVPLVPVAHATAPTAGFAATVARSRLSVDAGASSDADGMIASYAWDWGDSSPAGTGAAATHTYAAAGLYLVRLTVTDDDGESASVSRTVRILPAIELSGFRYDALPLGTAGHVAHYAAVLRVTGGPVKDVVVTVTRSGLGAGAVGGSRERVGSQNCGGTAKNCLLPGLYTIDVYQDAPGLALEACASATGADAGGVHIETEDGTCAGPSTALGAPVSVA